MVAWAIPVAMAAGQAILGMYQGRKQQEAQDRARQDQARINMYAPLLGQQIQALPAQQDMQTIGGMQGALSGFQMGQQYNMDQKLAELYQSQVNKNNVGAAPNTASTNTSTLTPIENPYVAPQPAAAAYAGGMARPFGFIPEGPYLPGQNPNDFWRR